MEISLAAEPAPLALARHQSEGIMQPEAGEVAHLSLTFPHHKTMADRSRRHKRSFQEHLGSGRVEEILRQVGGCGSSG
jgi:hypothetical protein